MQVRECTTGSAGQTFSRPQSGIILRNDPGLTTPLADAIFPALAATYQVNRVEALAKALDESEIPALCAHKGYI